MTRATTARSRQAIALELHRTDCPLAQAPGHDINYTAISGALHFIGRSDDTAPPLCRRSWRTRGGYGRMNEYLIAHMYPDARAQRIYGGTNDITQEVISRAL
jgi:alkylation response protein AidB-like acyl-CoA dehydrogenase